MYSLGNGKAAPHIGIRRPITHRCRRQIFYSNSQGADHGNMKNCKNGSVESSMHDGIIRFIFNC